MNKSPKDASGSRAPMLALVALLAAGCGGSTASPQEPAELDPQQLLGEEPDPTSEPTGKVASAVDQIKQENFAAARALLEPDASGSEDPQLHYYLGVAQANTGETEAAIASLRRALELMPKFSDASLNLAAFLLDEGEPQEALTVVDAGLEHAPKDTALLQNKAFALLSLGQAAAAAPIYAELVEAAPKDEALRFTYAQTLAEAKQPEAAAEELSKLKSSKDIAVLNSVADMFGRMGDYDQCIGFADAAIAIAPKSELYVRRGVCRGSKKDEQGATADFKLAAAADPKSAAAHYYLGRSLSKKDKPAARAALKQAVSLAGDNAKLKAAAEGALKKL